jgi:hypothetical protein
MAKYKEYKTALMKACYGIPPRTPYERRVSNQMTIDVMFKPICWTSYSPLTLDQQIDAARFHDEILISIR